ncbi:hypothetical protein GCM10027577_49380 [Spirosoma fluminis]
MLTGLGKKDMCMQKRLALFLLLFAAGCKKDIGLPDPASSTLTVASHPHRKAEPLNGDYSIQFPPGYEGNGMVGFEGPVFVKNRMDKQATFTYSFCSSLSCSPYGPAIPIPYPSVSYPPTLTLANTVLDQAVAIMRDNQLQAVFYFTKEPQALGVVYLKDVHGGVLKQSLSIQYTFNLHSEVLGILQTIQPR